MKRSRRAVDWFLGALAIGMAVRVLFRSDRTGLAPDAGDLSPPSSPTRKQWAGSLLASMGKIASLMDEAFASSDYSGAISEQLARVADPELTTSARVLREMREKDLPFFRLAMEYSAQWAEHFRSRPLSPEVQARYEQESRRSRSALAAVEQSDEPSFDEYLRNFYSQYQCL